jgi:hypothetical protein
MNQHEFEHILDGICTILTDEASGAIFRTAGQFEKRVREALQEATPGDGSITIDFLPHPQAFPDIAAGRFGIEVKFTLNDTWRSIPTAYL